MTCWTLNVNSVFQNSPRDATGQDPGRPGPSYWLLLVPPSGKGCKGHISGEVGGMRLRPGPTAPPILPQEPFWEEWDWKEECKNPLVYYVKKKDGTFIAT